MKTIRHFTALVAILGLVLAFAGTNVEAKANNSASTSDSSTSSDTKFKGKITAIDTSDKTVTVKSKEGDLTLTVTKKLSKLKLAVGDKVKGSYTTDSSGKMTAVVIKKSEDKKKDTGADTTSA